MAASKENIGSSQQKSSEAQLPQMQPSVPVFFEKGKKAKQIFTMTKSDSSIFPSYAHLTLPYCVICRQRYWRACKKQREQFIREVATQELLQATALDGVRVHREFCQYIFSKPSSMEKITLTPQEEARLQKILGC